MTEIVALASLKGGVGKTTSGLFLANYLARHLGPGKVAFVDRDPNENITKTRPKFPYLIPPDVDFYEGEVIPEGYEYIIVDTPPRKEIVEFLSGVRKVVVPVVLEQQNFSLLPDYLEWVYRQGLQTGLQLLAVLPTRVERRDRDYRGAIAALGRAVQESSAKPFLLPEVPERVQIARWNYRMREYDPVAKEIFPHVQQDAPAAE